MTVRQSFALRPPADVSASPSALAALIASKRCTVGVIGLGYVGLPLIDAFVSRDVRTLGFDIDPVKVEALNAGRSYIQHIGGEKVSQWRSRGLFEATSDLARLGEPDALLICVPTPLTDSRDPDLSYVVRTAESIAVALRPGQLVVLESTTYPTTTRDVVRPILDRSGLELGKDYFLAYSPEREDPVSLELACALYRHAVVQVVPVSSAEVAEACKILENTYRAVNIALVNELKILFDRMGIDIWEVIAAAKTKPFGFQAFYPGPGLGGHCIPIDPFYLTWIARKHGLSTRFIELAGEVNHSMPEYVVAKVGEFLNDLGKPIRGSRICVLGAAYKKDVDDPRESPSFVLMELLLARGAVLTYNDPHIPRLPKVRHSTLPEMSSQPLTPEFLAQQDCVLIATNHSAYDYEFIVRHSRLVVDTRNATAGVAAEPGTVRKA
jgi:UDP-N-acetyl-D-glucosamine dehydrogenase